MVRRCYQSVLLNPVSLGNQVYATTVSIYLSASFSMSGQFTKFNGVTCTQLVRIPKPDELGEDHSSLSLEHGICAFLQYTLRAVRTVWAATYESCLLLWEVLGKGLSAASPGLPSRAGYLLSPWRHLG